MGFESAELAKVLVFRGLPSNLHQPVEYSRNLAQAAFWTRDNRVSVIHRPLKYIYKRDTHGIILKDEHGVGIYTGKQEKGIDVLCALAVVSQARASDLVILSSQDTDLIPALNEAAALQLGKIETSSWYLPGNHTSREIRCETTPLWNTRLNSTCFEKALDLNDYSN